ncbi:hypothetical protein SELMODRAFT_413510 [Selaginella moellendorffii]|uniref:Uncharacterized protein n=1 Tax=Selaginella moellendorffii TaxID=88036 RepID=D8RPQ4_SELML|nr:hypothetical protein SELMODRAFT_413510 [Selaginella moellendorffii]
MDLVRAAVHVSRADLPHDVTAEDLEQAQALVTYAKSNFLFGVPVVDSLVALLYLSRRLYGNVCEVQACSASSRVHRTGALSRLLQRSSGSCQSNRLENVMHCLGLGFLASIKDISHMVLQCRLNVKTSWTGRSVLLGITKAQNSKVLRSKITLSLCLPEPSQVQHDEKEWDFIDKGCLVPLTVAEALLTLYFRCIKTVDIVLHVTPASVLHSSSRWLSIMLEKYGKMEISGKPEQKELSIESLARGAGRYRSNSSTGCQSQVRGIGGSDQCTATAGVLSFSMGLDKIGLKKCKVCRVVVTNMPNMLMDETANLAMVLLLRTM